MKPAVAGGGGYCPASECGTNVVLDKHTAVGLGTCLLAYEALLSFGRCPQQVRKTEEDDTKYKRSINE